MNPRDFLDKNLALFARMKDLAARQRELVSKDQMQLFLQLTTEREKLQHQISSNEESYRRETRVGRRERTHDKSPSVTHDIIDVIHSIQETDRRIEDLLSEKKDQILTEARTLRHGQSALKGYGRKTQKAPRYVSREG